MRKKWQKPVPAENYNVLSGVTRSNQESHKELDAIEKSVDMSPLDLSKERTAVSKSRCQIIVRRCCIKNSVFEEMLKCGSYKDVKLVRDISKGFGLMATCLASVFSCSVKPLHLTPNQVKEFAALRGKAILASVSRLMEDNICKGVFEATMKELEAGWITDPICSEQLDEKHPQIWSNPAFKKEMVIG